MDASRAKFKLNQDQIPQRVRENMKILREKKILFDFKIQADESIFSAHKFLLASYSDYFRAMFTYDSQESQKSKVHLQDVTAEAMGAILDFCYESRISLSQDNVQEILIASSILQIDEILNLCINFIKERVDVSNCLGVLLVAERCNLPELFQSTANFCLDNFESVIDESEFYNLDEFWLTKIISHDRLNVCKEDKVFQAIINWISAKPEERKDKLDSLMSHVRLSLIDPVKLVSISKNELIRESMVCRDLIDEAKNFLLLQNHPEMLSRITGPRFQERVPRRKLQRIYAVGGWTNEYKPISKVEKYNPFTDEWAEVKPMTSPRCGVGVTILDDSLYAIGGHDGHNYLKSVERYDISNDLWYTDVSDMNSECTSVGVVSLDGYIYAIGGQIASNPTSKVERYDCLTNTWKECRPLLEKRLGAGVTVLNGVIYVVGGADSGPLNTVECYDPATDSWSYKASMTTSRKHLGCTSYGGKIYAVGGRDPNGRELDSAECYDPKEDTWQPISRMNEKRSGIGLVELDNLIYAIGGNIQRLVQVYDPVSDSWSMKRPLIYERLGGGVAVYSPMVNFTIFDNILATAQQASIKQKEAFLRCHIDDKDE